eukprot:TRINITY_DN186_c0_g2_i2.p1 TRINITY_DN186_c0_g2~~TRINITY_DN186_c0_g2_i2.p1  ORF type:complete len:684 (+),score=111.29 TRINITY_DN186_c0_g2_i2:245-2053(+)
MAAGASAPEFFISIMGVFVTYNDIGIGTMVGSSAFNSLFLVGLCAYVYPGLTLTWWPLTRDAFFYCFSIFLLAMFVMDNRIEWWECATLLGAFFAYVVMIKYHELLADMIETRVEKEMSLRNNHTKMLRMQRIVESNLFSLTVYGAILVNIVTVVYETEWSELLNWICILIFIIEMLAKFGAYGVMGYWTDSWNCVDGVLVLLIAVELILSTSVKKAGGMRGIRILKFMKTVRYFRVIRLASYWLKQAADTGIQTAISFPDHEKVYLELGNFEIENIYPLRSRMAKDAWEDDEDEMLYLCEATARDRAITALDRRSVIGRESIVEKLNIFRKPQTGRAGAEAHIVRNKVWAISEVRERLTIYRKGNLEDYGRTGFVEKLRRITSSCFLRVFEKMEQTHGVNAEEFWSIPKDYFGRILWIVKLPLAALFYFSIPTCNIQNPAKMKSSFLMCIFWIAVLSYIVVWMASVIGVYIGLTPQIFGMTILAVGTSIPDALCSLALARKGLGDLAVSAAFGRNIFNVLVGLPLPWLLYTTIICTGKEVAILNEALPIMIISLLLMVACMALAVNIYNWILKRRLGDIFCFLYVCYILLGFQFEYKWINV